MNMSDYTWTIRGALITPVLLLIAFFSMGGGHGSYAPAIFLFPAGMLSIVVYQVIELPFMIAALIQYPLYGIILDRSQHKGITAGVLAAVHLLLFVVIYTQKSGA